jgi:hypothetical protein
LRRTALRCETRVAHPKLKKTREFALAGFLFSAKRIAIGAKRVESGSAPVDTALSAKSNERRTCHAEVRLLR